MRISPVFSDNMVLQAHTPVRIFGSCDAGEKITVTIPELSVSAAAFVDGERWEAVLPPMEYADCVTVSVVSGGESVVFRNVAVGEVWLAGGQSNMEFELHSDKNGMSELSSCASENIRYYYTPKQPLVNEELFAAEENTGWMLPSETASWAWSAAAYYFAKELSRRLGVTVGILGCNWGGTSATAWMSREYLEHDDRLKPYLDDYDSAVEGRTDEEMIREYDEYTVYQADWEKRMQEYYAEHPLALWDDVLKICGENRYPGPMGMKNPMRPCGLYETMVKRVAPYTIKGVLWYQGESDDCRPEAYSTLLPAMIQCWRDTWKDDTLPFLIVQLPMFRYEGDPDYKHWAVIREAQLHTFRTVRNTGLAVILDCGEFNNIHPVRKAQVGHRLYLQALSEVYGETDRSETLPPIFRTAYRSENGDMRLLFDNCEGFVLKGSSTPEGFEYAGADGVFRPAEACIDGNEIVLKCREEGVRAVRFQWINYALVTLFGTNGLPVPPFRWGEALPEQDTAEATVIRTV